MIVAFHKPYGVLSQWNENPDYQGQQTLEGYDLYPILKPLGRLDRDSEGLLLLSNEDGLEQELLHPKRAHSRTYVVQLDGVINEQALDQLSQGGLSIQNYQTLPTNVRSINPPQWVLPRSHPVEVHASRGSSWIEMTLREGKNRQVRRMVAKVGFPALRLIRTHEGRYPLGDLAASKWVELSASQRDLLFL